MKVLSEYIDSNREKIAAIKLSLNHINHLDISITATVAMSIEWEYKYYLQSKNKDYLYIGLLIIEAYLELGFSYESGQAYFDLILSALNIDEAQLFCASKIARKIKLNKAQVNELLWNWRAPKNKRKPEVIEEIIYNVTNKKIGRYTYSNFRGHKYLLVISDTECYIYDSNRDVYYCFVDDNNNNL